MLMAWPTIILGVALVLVGLAGILVLQSEEQEPSFLEQMTPVSYTHLVTSAEIPRRLLAVRSQRRRLPKSRSHVANEAVQPRANDGKQRR